MYVHQLSEDDISKNSSYSTYSSLYTHSCWPEKETKLFSQLYLVVLVHVVDIHTFLLPYKKPSVQKIIQSFS